MGVPLALKLVTGVTALANRRIPITRPIFDNFDSAGQIHNRRGGTALIDNAQKYDEPVLSFVLILRLDVGWRHRGAQTSLRIYFESTVRMFTIGDVLFRSSEHDPNSAATRTLSKLP